MFCSGDHIPLRSDSILVHPVTMATCNLSIACPVLVVNSCGPVQRETEEEDSPGSKTESEVVTERETGELAIVCRVWPLSSLPLDGV